MNALNDAPKPILRHSVIGPSKDGMYLVVYASDQTKELTLVCECKIRKNAEREAARLNEEQLRKEREIQAERRLRGFRRMVIGDS